MRRDSLESAKWRPSIFLPATADAARSSVSDARSCSIAGRGLVGLLLACTVVMPAAAAVLTPAADTYVHGVVDKANVAFGQAITLRVKDTRIITLIRFTNLPTAAGSAKLAVRVKWVDQPGSVSAYVVNGPWTESTTWNTRPPIATTPVATQPIAAANVGGWIEFDISAAVAGWIANPATNHGIALKVVPGSNAFIAFSSREGGPAPTLTVTAPPPNRVTVSLSGGNYQSPIDAADNAFAGDTWCVSPVLPSQPCIMQIDAGIYLLSRTLVIPNGIAVNGIAKDETILLAKKGIEVAVDSSATVMRDLSIVSHQDGLARAVALQRNDVVSAPQSLENVSVSVSGAGTNIAFRNWQSDFAAILRNCDIVAFGGESSLGVGNSGAGVRLFDSRVSVMDATQSNVGVDGGSRGGVDITDTVVSVSGGSSAVGVKLSSDEYGYYSITRGAIHAASSGTAIGVSHTFYGTPLTIIGTEIVAAGPGAIGVYAGVTEGSTVLDGVAIQASQAAVRFYDANGDGELDVLRSKLISGAVALEITFAHAMRIRVDSSMLRGPYWISETTGSRGPIAVSNSVLDGLALPGGMTVSCVNTLGSTYQPLGANCLPP